MSYKSTDKKVTNIITIVSIVAVLVFGAVFINELNSDKKLSFAQSGPTNPGAGATNTLPVAPTTPTSSNTTSAAPTTQTPVTPLISSEAIVEGSATTTSNPVTAPTNSNPTTPLSPTQSPIATPNITASNQAGTAQASGSASVGTARSGGLEVGIGLIALIAAIFSIYYYKTKGDRKSNFKTLEKKIKFRR
jgi:cytoskeletal protein RodZ